MKPEITPSAIRLITSLLLVAYCVLWGPQEPRVAYGQDLSQQELLKRGRVLQKQGDLDEAIEYFEKAVEREPGTRNATDAIRALNTMSIAIDLGDWVSKHLPEDCRKSGLSPEAAKACADEHFAFNGQPIHPSIIQDLTTSLADTGDQVVAINLTDSMGSNRYCCESDVKIRESLRGRSYIFVENEERRWSFGYYYVGRTTSGIHVIFTSYWGGGSGVFRKLMLVTIQLDAGASLKSELNSGGGIETIRINRDRVIIKKLGRIALGDRYDGDLSVEGNTVMIGKDQGWFSVSGGSGGGYITEPIKVLIDDR